MARRSVTLRLFPEYEAMQRARGVKASRRPISSFPICRRARRSSARRRDPGGKARVASRHAATAVSARAAVVAARRREAKAPTTMRDAVAGDRGRHRRRRTCARSGGRSARCSMRSPSKGLESSFGVKQLVARIDLQIRRVAEGSTKVADRLRREVLYYVAISAPVDAVGARRAARVQAVRRSFRRPRC